MIHRSLSPFEDGQQTKEIKNLKPNVL